MRVHSDILTPADVRDAAREASERTGSTIYVESSARHGSRRRDHALEISLSADGKLSKRRRNTGTRGGGGADYAATWEQWGWVLAYLFEVADDLTIPRVYVDRDAFHAATRWQFVRD